MKSKKFAPSLKSSSHYKVTRTDDDKNPTHISFAINGAAYRAQLIATGQLHYTDFTPWRPSGQALPITGARVFSWPEHEFFTECERQANRPKRDIYGKEYSKND